MQVYPCKMVAEQVCEQLGQCLPAGNSQPLALSTSRRLMIVMKILEMQGILSRHFSHISYLVLSHPQHNHLKMLRNPLCYNKEFRDTHKCVVTLCL